MDQAEADKNIAQAKAEERRSMAIASEQEMKAKAQEARAKVIEAEALVPLVAEKEEIPHGHRIVQRKRILVCTFLLEPFVCQCHFLPVLRMRLDINFLGF